MRFWAAILFVAAALVPLSTNTAGAQSGPLKVGLASPSLFTIMYHVAQDMGFFEKEGVRVEINHFESGSVNMRALLARAVDVSDVETGLILGAVANNADLRVIGTHSQRLHYGLYTKKDINDLEALYGRTFGISGIGGLPHLVFLALFEKYGLEPDRVNLVAVGGTGARLSALAAGKIDATLGEYSPVIEAEPSLHRLMIISHELPDYMAQGIAVWEDTLTEKRDALERMMRALVQATRWTYDNKAAFVEYASHQLPSSAADLSKIYDFYIDARVWAINGEVSLDSLAYMQKLGLQMNTQTAPVNLDELVYLDIYKGILDSLGTREYPR